MRNSYTVLTTDAFILHTRGIGEADRMITVLTRENGVLDVYARSIRKETAKMRGAVKPYGQVRLSLIQGKKNILKDIIVTDTLDAIWNEQKKYRSYVNLLKHIHALVPAVSEEDESLFSIAQTAVQLLQDSDVNLAEHILLVAQVLVLNTLGYVSNPTVPHTMFIQALREVSRDTKTLGRFKQCLNNALYHQ